MKPNPPIPGHELLFEGMVRGRLLHVGVLHIGGCRCGAKPPGWPDVSMYAMRRWHRQHKADLRAAGGSS